MIRKRGACARCGQVYSKVAMLAHLQSCLAQGSGPERLLQLRVESPTQPQYWMDLEVKAGAPLAALDSFLREVWLDCCGHLSQFMIRNMIYSIFIEDPWPNERSMDISCHAALGESVAPFAYEYDFGSTTVLKLRVTGRTSGSRRRELVRLLARNEPPVYGCTRCGQPAVSVCAACSTDTFRFACNAHESHHRGCDSDAWLPITNSPRTGVCAYGG